MGEEKPTTLFERMASISKGDLHKDIAASHPSLARGQVWCRSCGSTQRVDSAHALRHGWPICCGATMTIDSPPEHP